MRTVIVLRQHVTPLVETCLSRLTKIIQVISSSPSNPKFNHYAFETLALFVRFSCSQQPELVKHFEQFLFPPFQTILQQEGTGKRLFLFTKKQSCFYTCRFYALCLSNIVSIVKLS